jgi:PKD repeat protein
MTKFRTISLFALLLVFACNMQISAQTCPGCTIILPAMPVDTVYLDTIPDARQNEYYEEQLSFRLPMTTTPLQNLDTSQSIPGGVNLSAFIVQGISGLPLGMSFTLDRPLPARYDETAPDTRDGCVTICGTPRQAGLFTVNISVLVETGILAPQPATIPLSFLVLPDTSAGFTMTNANGCAPLTVSFDNNISPDTSVGQTAAYFWDFGNGQTSTDVNPSDVVYSDSGTYEVTYQAVITEAVEQVFLSTVTVGNSPCSDFGSAVDLFITVTGSQSGTDTVTTYTLNAGTPVTWNFGNNILLVPGTYYEIWVQDDDAIAGGIPGPEDCGRVNFSADTTANTFTLTNGQLSVTVTLTRSTLMLRDTFSTTDFVVAVDCNSSIAALDEIAGSFNIYPNPTSGDFTVQFETTETQNQEVSIKITDMLGRTMHDKNLGTFNGLYSETYNLREYGAGIYLMQLQVGNNLFSKKIIVR